MPINPPDPARSHPGYGSIGMEAVEQEKVGVAEMDTEGFDDVERLRQTLAECKASNELLVAELRSRDEHILALRYWLRGLDEDLSMIFASWRWRLGHAAVTLLERLLLRGRVPLAKDHVEQLLAEFRAFNPLVDQRTLFGVELPAGGDFKAQFTAIKRRELEEYLTSGATLDFTATRPQVSIILVLFNRAELTLACLKSIKAKAPPGVELVIVDNDSEDETPQLLESLRGATVLSNRTNEGFLKGCNSAVARASGDYVLFLNNDAQLMSNAVTSALQAIGADASIGAVGGKIITLDGRLQEAGSIVWRDGSCLGYGRGAAPLAPEYMFRREVDYCSGAFLLTPRALFNELGGFDEALVPAYYEETDYCFRLQESGLRVLYLPESMIIHYEFASAAMREDAIDLQKRNKGRFAAKHQERLRDQLPPDLSNVLRARFARGGKRKLLYLDDRVPHRALGSGFPRSNEIICHLASRDYDITLYPLNFPAEDPWSSAYADIDAGIEIMLGYGRANLARFLQERMEYFDDVLVSRPHNMRFFLRTLSTLEQPEQLPRIIYDAEAVFAKRHEAELVLKGKGASRSKIAQELSVELAYAKAADIVLSVSPAERQMFLDAGYDNVHVVAEYVDASIGDSEPSARSGLLFVGNLDYDDSPNVDSLVWFVGEVLPLIRGSLPDVSLDVVGTNRSARVRRLAGDGVVLHGRVKDVSPWYHRARVFVAPTRFASGIPRKVIEASAYGLPVVATDLLVSQLGWQPGSDIASVPVSDAQGFARECVNLLTDGEHWKVMRESVLQQVAVTYSRHVFVASMDHVLADIADYRS